MRYNGAMAKHVNADLDTVNTSLRLSQTGETLRAKLAQLLGVTKTAVIELALREFAKKHGVTADADGVG